jgi:Tol biopolymer transport system component
MTQSQDIIDSVAFSPDGSLVAIAMASQGDGATDIYRAIWDGHRLYNHVQLTATRGIWELYPTWINDGSRLLVTRATKYLLSYWTMDWDGTHQKLILDESALENPKGPRFAPDGDLMVYSQWYQDKVYLFASRLSDTSHVTQLTTGPWGYDTFRAFSPNATDVLLVREALGGSFGDTLLSVSVNGGEEIPIFHAPGVSIHAASWSPDGEWIAFVVEDARHEYLNIIRPDGTGLTQVTSDSSTWKTSPTWATARHKLP